jgi:hypothetical protein
MTLEEYVEGFSAEKIIYKIIYRAISGSQQRAGNIEIKVRPARLERATPC